MATGRSPAWIALSGDAVKALLDCPVLAKTPHFVLHARTPGPVAQGLPTDGAPDRNQSVDNSLAPIGIALVVPKRHARRAVTRNLIKRQMRFALQRHLAHWPCSALLVRLRGAFEPERFASAASPLLRQAVRVELGRLFERPGVTS